MVNEEYTKVLHSLLGEDSKEGAWVEVEEVREENDVGVWVVVYIDNVEDYSFKVPVTVGECEAEWVENELRNIYEEVR